MILRLAAPLRAALLVVATNLAAVPSYAAGTLGLDDVLEAVKTNAKLVAEINDELKKNNLKMEGTFCIGARHGNQWTHLGGMRAAPYECEIGNRVLVIEADRTYYDARRRSLGELKKANPKRAESFKETNFRWTWKPKE